MHYNLSQIFRTFFEKNLFERLIVYILLSHFLTTFIFVFLLGQWGFGQSQNQQWVFYGLLGLDYLLSFRKVLNIRFRLNPSSIFALFIFIMIAHGLFIGVLNHNRPFVILNDTIPLLMIALNILRMQSLSELSKPIDFKFICYAVITVGFATAVSGALGTYPTIGNGGLFFPLMMATLLLLRPLPIWVIILTGVTLLLVIGDINRTTMLFFALIFGLYFSLQLIYYPTKTILVMFLVIVLGVMGWTILPKDSKTYTRITDFTEIDLSKRTGSVGERQAEQDAVKAKLANGGPFMKWTGSGFGGVYDVQFTHEYLYGYGHAHYSWVWFNLRFGKIGYFYLLVLTSLLFINLYAGIRARNPEGYCISFLCLNSLLYLLTYVNGIFLLSGLQFKNIRKHIHHDHHQQ